MVRGVLTALLLVPAALPVAAADPGPAGWRCATGVATAYRHDPPRDRRETLVIPVGDQRFRVLPGPGGWALWRDDEPAPLARCAGGPGNDHTLRCGAGFELDTTTLVFSSELIALPPDSAAWTGTSATGHCTPLQPPGTTP